MKIISVHQVRVQPRDHDGGGVQTGGQQHQDQQTLVSVQEQRLVSPDQQRGVQVRRNIFVDNLMEIIFSEHDVANVLKRFIRQLDEPVLTDQLRDGFLRAANIEQVRSCSDG